ncbi:DUF4384 domain-containing protein [Desulfomarina sp.]
MKIHQIKIVFKTVLFFLVLPGAVSSFALPTFEMAAGNLLQGVQAGKVIGFVDLTGSNGVASKLAAEIFQEMEPILIREGLDRQLAFIERKDLKLIFDEWALDSFSESGDAGARTILGADYIITGKAKISGEFVQCSLKLIQLDNGRILAAAEGYVQARPYYYQWEQLPVEQKKEKRLQVPEEGVSSDGKLHFWTDKKRYLPGDTIKISFKVSEPLYVKLIDVTPDGKVTTIYPNIFQPEELCSPGRVYTVPPEKAQFKLEVTPPAGIDRIKALAGPQPFPDDRVQITRGVRFTRAIVEAAPVRAALSFEIAPDS